MPDWVKGREKEEGQEALSDAFWTGDGHLPVGIHDTTLDEFRLFAATTPYRREMWNRLVAFLSWPVTDGRFSYVYIGGGFASATPHPRDIDLILQTREPYGPEAFHVIERYFRVGLETINDVFGIHLHFWMENAPSGFTDYRLFFQYAKLGQSPEATSQGLVRISLQSPDVKSRFHQLLGGFELSDDLPSPESMNPPSHEKTEKTEQAESRSG